MREKSWTTVHQDSIDSMCRMSIVDSEGHTKNSTLSYSSNELRELDELLDSRERILVNALTSSSIRTQNILKDISVTDFLIRHELNQISSSGVESSRFECGDGEFAQTESE